MLPAPGSESLTLGLQGQCSTPTPRELTNPFESYFVILYTLYCDKYEFNCMEI